MRAPFQAGELPGPVKYGYASVGTVVERGPRDLEGRDIFALFPHQSRYVVPAADVHVLPPAVPPSRAILAANLETAVNGVWDAEPQPDDRVTVIGAGAVGCLVAYVARRIDRLRRGAGRHQSRARADRARVRCPLRASGRTRRRARPSSSMRAVRRPGSNGRCGLPRSRPLIVEMSWYGCQPVALPLGEAFHAQRLTIRSSQVGHVARPKRAQFDRRARMQVALSLLDDAALDVLITGESPFDELPAGDGAPGRRPRPAPSAIE